MSVLRVAAVLRESPWEGEGKQYAPGGLVPCPSLLCSLGGVAVPVLGEFPREQLMHGEF